VGTRTGFFLRHKQWKSENGSSAVGWGGMDWIGLAQDRDRWRAVANTVMNLRVS
jgi:hypothetical protein